MKARWVVCKKCGNILRKKTPTEIERYETKERNAAALQRKSVAIMPFVEGADVIEPINYTDEERAALGKVPRAERTNGLQYRKNHHYIKLP